MNATIAIIKRVIGHDLISGSLFIFLGSILGGFLSFLFNLFLARTLTYSDYGIITTLVSSFGLLTIPSQSITTTLVQFATSFFSKDEYDKGAYLYLRSLRILSLVSVFVFMLFVLSSRLLGSFLHISNVSYIIITGIMVSSGYIAIVNTAFLQSLLKFDFISLLGFLGNLLKVAFGALFVILGFKIYGVFFGLLLMAIIPLVLSFYPLRFLFKTKIKKVELPKKHIAVYGIIVAITTMCISSFISTDLILVKHFFPSVQAGLYAGLTLTGKAIFYLTAPIATVLFPVIIRNYNQGKNFNKTFFLALGLVGIPSLLITLFYYLFPQFTIHFFLGGRSFLRLSSLTWLYGLFITEFSLVNICVTFFLSLRRMTIVIPLVLGAIFQIAGISLFHKDFLQVILSSLVTLSILLIVLLLYYLKYYGTKKKTPKKP